MKCNICKIGTLEVDPKTFELYCPVCGVLAEESVDDSLPSYEILSPHHEAVYYALPGKGFVEPLQKGFKFYKVLKNAHHDVFLDKTERSFADSYYAFTSVFGGLRLSNETKEEAGLLYRRCIKKGLTKGREKFGMMLAIADIVCKSSGIKRDIGLFAKYYSVDAKSVAAYEKSIEKMLESEKIPAKIFYSIGLVISSVGAGAAASDYATKMAKEFLKNNKTGRKHLDSIAGAIAYAAIKETGSHVKEEEVARILGISERSLRRVITGYIKNGQLNKGSVNNVVE
ncbi:MAG: hypothetical protein ACP5RP_03250 [Candidatus Micrarchaeia archaeon]